MAFNDQHSQVASPCGPIPTRITGVALTYLRTLMKVLLEDEVAIIAASREMTGLVVLRKFESAMFEEDGLVLLDEVDLWEYHD